MKKYLRSKNHIKAQQLVIVGRERKKVRRMAREFRQICRFALATGEVIAMWAKTVNDAFAPLIDAIVEAAKAQSVIVKKAETE